MENNSGNVPIPVQNIYDAYLSLGNSVHVALRTQVGDMARLGEQKRLCLALLSHITEHAVLVPNEERLTITTSVGAMLEALEGATAASSDQPDAPPLTLGDRTSSGSVGRPAVHIPPEELAVLASGRVTLPRLAELYNCHPRTIRRRLLDYGLAQPGPPVYTDHQQPNGTVVRNYMAGSSSNLSQLDDHQLDQLILSIYHRFPSFGRRMIDGYLLQLGERVPRSRLEASYHRVIGPSPAAFGPRRIQRRVYSVPGPMALVHHDGQHGLIRWKIVLHAFIDGYSRFVLGIRASNNNRAQTVLDLFDDIASVFGYPSRVRGDHGTENLLVAARMEEIRGAERGSYIWGRSVHNIRIERLWVDVTSGFGSKWKDFFQGLEAHDGLDANMDSHIWLLHHLFLSDINEDASQWASTWNYHILQRRGEPHRSPQEMFLQGMVEHGQRAVVVAVDEDIGDIAEYGVDWNDIDNHNVRNHHDTFNPQDDHLSNPFVSNQPDRLSHVDVPNARCPLSPEQAEVFDTHLQTSPYHGQPDMESRQLLWIEALDMVTRMW